MDPASRSDPPNRRAGDASHGRKSPSEGDVAPAFAELLAACPPEYRFAFRCDDLNPSMRVAFQGEAVMAWRSLAPRGSLDWADLRDIAMNGAEVAGLRSMLAQTLRSGERAELGRYLEERLPGLAPERRNGIAAGYLVGEAKDCRVVLELLATDGFTEAVFTARARLRHEHTIRDIERSLAATEKRRQRILRDMRGRRSLRRAREDGALEGAGADRGG